MRWRLAYSDELLEQFEKNDDRHFHDVFAASPTAEPAFSRAVVVDFAALPADFCVRKSLLADFAPFSIIS